MLNLNAGKNSYLLRNLNRQKARNILLRKQSFDGGEKKEATKIYSSQASTSSTSPMTIPNILSFSRICTSPIISYLIVAEYHGFASLALIISAFTDVLDGSIARRFPSQRSSIGCLLDPIADKILVNTAFLTLAYVSLIPVPLAVIVLLRDIFLIVGVALFRYQTMAAPNSLKRFFDFSISPLSVTPTNTSKANTLLQFASIICTLLFSSLHLPAADHLALDFLYALTGVTTVISGIQYAIGRAIKLKQ